MILKTEQPDGRLGALISRGNRLLVVQPIADGGFVIELWDLNGALSVTLDRAEVARIIDVLAQRSES